MGKPIQCFLIMRSASGKEGGAEMIYEEINYTADGRVKLKTYIPDVYTRGEAPLREAMIACPGGAWLFQHQGKLRQPGRPKWM